MPTNEYNRHRYRLMIEAGLCPRCSNPTVGGKSLCPLCEVKHKNKCVIRRNRRIEVNVCASCGNLKEQENKRKCNACLERNKNSNTQKKAERIAKGLCQYCGEPCGKKNCEGCLLKMVSTNVFGTTVRYRELREIYDRQGGICPLSGRKITIGVDAELDHIVPKSRNGTNDIFNLQWLHVAVNQMKRNLLQEEFFALIEEIYSRHHRQ